MINTGTYKDTPVVTLAAGATITQWQRIYIDSSGTWQVAGAAQRFDAIALDNAASGDALAGLLRNKQGTFLMVANAALSAGAIVYAAASGKVGSSGTIPEGVVRGAAVTADGDYVEIEAFNHPPTLNELLFSEVAASAALVGNVTGTTETAFDQSYTFAANDLAAGDIIRIRAQGISTSTNSTDTLTIKVYVGSVEVATLGAVDVANNDIFFADIDVVIRTAGASGTCVAMGVGGNGASGTITAKGIFKASQTIDTTAANAVTVKATWSVNSASNSCRLDILNVTRIRK